MTLVRSETKLKRKGLHSYSMREHPGITHHAKAWHAQACSLYVLSMAEKQTNKQKELIKADEFLKGVTFKLHQHADTQHA